MENERAWGSFPPATQASQYIDVRQHGHRRCFQMLGQEMTEVFHVLLLLLKYSAPYDSSLKVPKNLGVLLEPVGRPPKKEKIIQLE
jgi:hypothetical protein